MEQTKAITSQREGHQHTQWEGDPPRSSHVRLAMALGESVIPAIYNSRAARPRIAAGGQTGTESSLPERRFRPRLEHKRIESSGAPSMMNLNASRARGRVLLGALTLLCLTAAALARPLRVEDLQNLARVGEVHISPDGLWAVFTVTRSDLAKNRSVTGAHRAGARHLRAQLPHPDAHHPRRPRLPRRS